LNYYVFEFQIDRDGSGYIELAELKQALDVCGFKIPSYQVRLMIEEVDREQSGPGKGRLSFDEFEHVIDRHFPSVSFKYLGVSKTNGFNASRSCAPS